MPRLKTDVHNHQTLLALHGVSLSNFNVDLAYIALLLALRGVSLRV